MLEIVAGVGHDKQVAGRQHAAEAKRQLGAADPARQRHDKTAVIFSPDNLILRSRAERGVSKDGQQQWCIPSFETALRASSG